MTDSPFDPGPRGTRLPRRILVGCYRGMGDLLYVSSILSQMKEDEPDLEIHLGAGRGLWSDAVRHLPGVTEVIPIDSWDTVRRIGAEGGFDRVVQARVSEWMPFHTYRGWNLRARLGGLHLIDVHARVLRVALRPEHRRPIYVFSEEEPEDDPTEARSLGSFALLALHGFTNAAHNDVVRERILLPLLEAGAQRGIRLVVTGPAPAGEKAPTPEKGLAAKGATAAEEAIAAPNVTDLRGRSIRRVATFVREASLVVTVLNGMAVLADALERPFALLAVGSDPVSVVGPIRTKPALVLGSGNRDGARGIDVTRIVELLEKTL